MTELTKANPHDAGYDLVAQHDATITNESPTMVHTGVYGDVPAGSVGFVCSRSGLAAKHGVFVVNSPGVVDASYTGEVNVILSKVGSEPYEIKAGDRIAQLVYLPLSAFTPGIVSDRGDGGFGSSGR